MIGKINHIRYAQLDVMLNGLFAKDDKVNLFINLEHLVRPLLGKNFKKYLQTRKEDRAKELISDILNIAAHYRKFFSNNGIYTKVFMYMGKTNTSKYLNQLVDENYRAPFYERFNRSDAKGVQGLIEEAFQLAKVITDYIDGVYILETTVIEPSIIPQHISKNGFRNVLLTNDLYEYQYAAYNDFIILRAKLDDSHIVTKENVVSKIKGHEKVATEITFDPSFTKVILAGLNDKYRGITNPKGLSPTKWFKLLNTLVEGHYLSSTNPDLTPLTYLPPDVIDTDVATKLVTNYKLVDIKQQEKLIKMDKIVDGLLVDKFDNVSLKEIGNLFTEYPINLIEIQDFAPSKGTKVRWD